MTWRYVGVNRAPAERPRQEAPLGASGSVLGRERLRTSVSRSAVVVPPAAVIDPIRTLPEGKQSVITAAEACSLSSDCAAVSHISESETL
jgi:hypothetical protein